MRPFVQALQSWTHLTPVPPPELALTEGTLDHTINQADRQLQPVMRSSSSVLLCPAQAVHPQRAAFAIAAAAEPNCSSQPSNADGGADGGLVLGTT